MWTFAGVLALLACTSAVTRDQFYPYGPGLDQNLPKGNEIPSPEVPLKVPITFYGETYESIFINNFGVLTFRADISSFLNIEFPLPYASIAAFYTNVDTTAEGAVYYRETDEPHVLSKAEESIQDNFRDYYDFKPTSVFITTWVDVTYTSNVSQYTPRNSFQIAVISNGTESFVEFLYPEREIQWFQKESQIISLPDAKAQAGFISEDGRIYSLRGSGSHQIRNIVLWSNSHIPGKYVFRIGQIPPDGNVATPDQYNQNEAEIEEESKTCAQSGPSVCHMEARCVDYSDGICCQCKDGFYGNGKSCIKDDVPLRVHGKINGVLNDVNLNDVDIQAYVVVGEGRAYTALSLVPGGLGSSLQVLNVLGGVVGWLFAKPSGSAKNGYQFTGAFLNHTADIWFPVSGERVLINQEYLGHDVFDQITLESDIRGSIPVILTGTKLEIADYEEQYTIVKPGHIRSESSRTFTNKITGEKIEQRVSQTITYSACHFAPPTAEDKTPLTLKISKNYLGFESRENIVRYGMTNRIFPLGQADPCIKGRSSCGPHSTCVAQGDSFSCVCQSGFTTIYLKNEVVCIDINECEAGTHNCDSNADCYNHAGGFQCRCRPGFNGNGFTCNPLSACYNKKCGTNAHCIQNRGQEATCACNPGFYGDGQLCYEINENRGLSEVTNEADYNESFVLPTCDAYTCVCPPGYSDYRDDLNNQLCRLDNNGVPSQTSESEYQSPTEPTYTYQQHTDAPATTYYQPQTERTYQPYSDRPYPSNTEQQYQTNTDPPYEPNSDDSYRIVQPTCDAYTCVCPPGYSDYIDEHNNPLCRLGNNEAPPQEPSGSEFENPTDPTYQQQTEAPETPYIPPHTDRPYQTYSDRPYQPNIDPTYTSPPLSYPAPWDSNYHQQQSNLHKHNQGENLIKNYEQNYDQNLYNNYENNNYEHNSANNDPNNYSQQSSNSNSQTPPEIDSQLPAENNYQQPDRSYYQPSENRPSENSYDPSSDNNYYQTSDNYETSTPTSYQPSSEYEYHQSVAAGPTEDTLIPCEDDTECPPNAVCFSPDGYNKHCVCPEGYEGDAFECIERSGPNCACGRGAHCVNTRTDEYICECDPGYHGDGYICRPNSSCRNNSDCEYNAECRPDPKTNEYICQCLKGYIKDQNDACIPDAQLCNGASCAEHASCLYDEELSLNYCHCDEGYTGEAISQCVLADQTCDITDDCSPDAICTPVDNSYQCVCKDGFNGDGYKCTPEATCRFDPNLCDLHASCLKKYDAYVCECNTGYIGNGSHCEYDSRRAANFLVASDGTSVYRVPFKATSRDFAAPFNSGQSQVAVDIDVDCESGIVYWGDVVSFAIKSSRYDGSDFNIFLTSGIKSPEGIAIDWSARNIFWTDSKKLTIEVANLETKVRKVLFAVDKIYNPRGVAVHPQRGKIFWSDWKRNDPKIEWASMDGSQRGIFLDKNDVAVPNALAIDWIRDRLCYADAGLLSIICVSIDTKEKTIIASDCSYPFGLAIHGNRFYWTDWKTLKIEYIDIATQERGLMPIATASRRLYGVAVAPDQCPPVNSLCMYRNGNCDPHQLCLPDGNNGRTCVDGDTTFYRR